MSQNSSPDVSRGCRGRILLFAAAAAALGTSASYAAWGQPGAGVVRLNAIGEITSDSNVFGDITDRDDFYYSFRPEIEYDRQGGRGRAHLDAGVSFDRYDTYSELNTENWAANGLIEMPRGTGGRLSGGLNFAFFDGAESDDFVGQRVEIQRLNFGLRSSYEVTGRTSVRFGAGVNRYDTNLRPEANSWSLRGGVSWDFRPNVATFLDYSHGSSKTDEDPTIGYIADYTTDNVSIGVEGQLSATISGSISIGYEEYSADTEDTVGDSDNLVADIGLTWRPRPNTDISISGGKQNRIASNGLSIDATTARFIVRQRLGVALTAEGTLLWETFETRGLANTDNDRVAASLQLEYSMQDNLGFGGGIRHNVRYSPIDVLDVSRTAVNIFARYTF